jgi:hypothetical protein
MSNEQPQAQPQSQQQSDKITLHPSNPLHAIEIVDQLLQPGTQMNRQAWTLAETCIASIRKALSKPSQE